MASYTQYWTLHSPGEQLSYNKSYSASGRTEIDETVTNGLTDFLINVAIDVTEVKHFLLVSDKAVTIETNDPTTPSNTIVLVADRPYEWDTNSYDAFLLTVDVTKIYVTNSSGSTATIKLRCLQDATP